MTEQKKRRNPYPDAGLMVAVSILIIMLIKTLLFGATWINIAWMALCVIYFFLSYKYDSESKVIKHSTTTFLVLSAVIFTSIIFLEQKPEPKMHAFEGGKVKKDSVEEEFILKKEPEVPTEGEISDNDTDSIIIIPDSTNTTIEGDADQQPATEEPSEENKPNESETESL